MYLYRFELLFFDGTVITGKNSALRRREVKLIILKQ